MKKIAILVSVLFLASTPLFAATGTASAAARIGAPLIITAGDTLSFGTIFVTDQTNGGTITLGWNATSSSLTTDGVGAQTLKASDVNDTAWVVTANDPALGTFTVNGPPAAALTYGVSVAPGTLVYTGTCPAGYTCNAMTMTPAVVDPSTATGSGATTFKVGGTLEVAGDQGEGSYTGTYTITANYQ